MKHLMILAAMMVMTITAKAMSYETAKDEALFLSDKMAYELDLTDEQYEAVYEINLDFLLCLNNPEDLNGVCWERRNDDLRDVLSAWQYDKYLTVEYFHHPVRWVDDAWFFTVYTHYMRDAWFFDAPKAFLTYKGGHGLERDHYYADRIANKPASADHHHAPAAHTGEPATVNNGNKLANPGNVNRPDANNRPDAPNNGNRPANPNMNRPTTPNRPAGGPGGGMGPGGGRPMGGRR